MGEDRLVYTSSATTNDSQYYIIYHITDAKKVVTFIGYRIAYFVTIDSTVYAESTLQYN